MIYELRIYTAMPGKMPALLTRFRDHTCEIFERHGMKNVGLLVECGRWPDGRALVHPGLR